MRNSEFPIVLLGAGASVPAGIPTAVGLTEKLEDMGGQQRVLDREDRDILRYLQGGIQMSRGKRGEKTTAPINIEELVEALRRLIGREYLPIAPFVSHWDVKLRELDKRRLDTTAFDPIKETIRQITKSIVDYSEDDPQGPHFKGQPPREVVKLADTMALELDELFWKYQRPPSGYQLQTTYDHVIKALEKVLWMPESRKEKVEYLSRLVREAADAGGTIVTLNYDNTVELAASTSGCSFHVGLDEWQSDGHFRSPSSGFELLKLHGSIDWKQQGTEFKHLKQREVFPHKRYKYTVLGQDEMENVGNEEPAIIFGTSNKLQPEGPYLDLFQAFRERLSTSDRILAIGYSFSDAHVNHWIMNWMNARRERKMAVVGAPDTSERDHPLWQKRGGRLPQQRCIYHGIGVRKALKRGMDDLFTS